jgi:hypothetical protein
LFGISSSTSESNAKPARMDACAAQGGSAAMALALSVAVERAVERAVEAMAAVCVGKVSGVRKPVVVSAAVEEIRMVRAVVRAVVRARPAS